tara:strand:+ start:796 stop:1002 length:207 start_codon:yes stop_codon:yes gene_type:complete
MVDLFGELICSDENPFNVECFEKSVSQLNKKLRKKVRYEGKSAEGCVEGGAWILSLWIRRGRASTGWC